MTATINPATCTGCGLCAALYPDLFAMVGEMATVLAEVESLHSPRFQRKDLGLVEVIVRDSSSVRLTAKWFHAQYLANVLTTGTRVAFFGKVEFDTYKGELAMLHPEFEVLREDDEDDCQTEPGGSQGERGRIERGRTDRQLQERGAAVCRKGHSRPLVEPDRHHDGD